MVSSFDLGGRFTDSAAVVKRLEKSDHFKTAHELEPVGMRLQASYRHSHELVVVAASEDVELDLGTWKGTAHQRTTLDPSGVITFETKMPLDPERLKDCSLIEDAFDTANGARYNPYLKAAFRPDEPDDESAPEVEAPLDLIAPVKDLRRLLSDLIASRPQVYPAIDMRVVVSAQLASLDDSSARYVKEFVAARRARAQLSEPPPTPAELEGQPLQVERSHVIARRWGSVLFASCDVDAVLILADDEKDRATAEQCVTMAQRMWFLARTWVGVLDQVRPVEIKDDSFDANRLQELELRVLGLSSLEYEIERSMVTVEAAGVMLRSTWNVQLVNKALDVFEVNLQRHLIDQRVRAVGRNHDTVTGVLNRLDQKAARAQASRLQILFAAAFASALAGLVPATDRASGHVAALMWVTFGLVWAVAAGLVWYLGGQRIPLGTRVRSRRRAAQPATSLLSGAAGYAASTSSTARTAAGSHRRRSAGDSVTSATGIR
jgi:hypothetical protein